MNCPCRNADSHRACSMRLGGGARLHCTGQPEGDRSAGPARSRGRHRSAAVSGDRAVWQAAKNARGGRQPHAVQCGLPHSRRHRRDLARDAHSPALAGASLSGCAPQAPGVSHGVSGAVLRCLLRRLWLVLLTCLNEFSLIHERASAAAVRVPRCRRGIESGEGFTHRSAG